MAAGSKALRNNRRLLARLLLPRVASRRVGKTPLWTTPMAQHGSSVPIVRYNYLTLPYHVI